MSEIERGHDICVLNETTPFAWCILLCNAQKSEIASQKLWLTETHNENICFCTFTICYTLNLTPPETHFAE